MLRHIYLLDMAFGPEMLLWGDPADLRALAGWLARFAAAPSPTPLTQAGACVAVDGRAILLLPSVERLGLRAAPGAGHPFEWRLDAALAQHFAGLSLSLADAHPRSGHHYLDGGADQEITVRLSLNEYPPHLRVEGA